MTLPTPEQASQDLGSILRGDFLVDDRSRAEYSTGAGAYQMLPLGIALPRDEEDICGLVRYARDRNVPLIPRGAGSGMGGHNVGHGILIDFTRSMNRILGEDPSRMQVRLQPGLVRDDLNRQLRENGHFFAPDPSSSAVCTVGGMIANNAGGLRTVKYGSTKHHVEALRVILPDASPITISRGGEAPPNLLDRARDLIGRHRDEIREETPGPEKHASGYDIWDCASTPQLDLTRLVVGSEGTLGIITEAVVSTRPIPESRGCLLAGFRDVRTAGESIPALLALAPSAIELMDRSLLDAIRRSDLAFDVGVPEEAAALLLIEFEGTREEEVHHRIETCRSLVSGSAFDACSVESATDPCDQARLWSVRKSSSALTSSRTDGKKVLQIVEDGGVRPSQVVDYLEGTKAIFDEQEIEYFAFGHIGNGNIHLNPLFDVTRRDFPAKVRAIADRVADLIISLDGTLTAEHGRRPRARALSPASIPAPPPGLPGDQAPFRPGFPAQPRG